MNFQHLSSLIAHTRDIGISFILLVGEEPFIRNDMLTLTQDFPEIIFTINTIGLFLDMDIISQIKKQKNIVPLTSLEGPQQETDQRRGQGVFDHNMVVMDLMKRNKIFFGVNVTITRHNFLKVFDEPFIELILAKGSTAMEFLKYLPLEGGTDKLQITSNQRRMKTNFIKSLRSRYPNIFFIGLPGDETYAGGRRSSVRGFNHVNSEGHLEPCVFFPTSDRNVKDVPLIEALKSPLFRTIRQSNEHDGDTKSGCALWKNRHLVDSSLRSTCNHSLLAGISHNSS